MEQKTVFEIRAVMPKEITEQSKTIATREERATTKKESRSSENIVAPDLSSGFKTAISTAATIYATSQVVINPIVTEYINKASVSGDYVQAANIARTQANVNRYIGLGMEIAGIGAAFLANPILGGVALVGSVSKHIQQGISREQRNRVIRETNNIDNFITSHESARFVNVRAGR